MRWRTITSNVSIRTISPTATPLPKAYDCVAVYIAGRRTNLVVYGWRRQPSRQPKRQHGTCVTHVLWCMMRSLTSGSFEVGSGEKRFRHSRCKHNSKFYVSDKKAMATHLVVGFFCHLGDHSILIGLVHTCHVLRHFLYIVLIYHNDRSMKRKHQSAIEVGYLFVQIELIIVPLKMFVSGLAFQDIAFNCDAFGRFGEVAIGFPFQRAVDICDV